MNWSPVKNDLFKLFDESNVVELDDSENKILERKNETLLKEGIKYWGDKTGVYSSKGQLIFTKVVKNKTDVSEFLIALVQSLSFAEYLTIDFHGLMRNGQDYVFIFGSQNSGIRIDDNRQFVLLENSHTRGELIKFFQKTTYEDYLEKWYSIHDEIGDLSASGLKSHRLLARTVFYEPVSLSVNKLFGI